MHEFFRARKKPPIRNFWKLYYWEDNQQFWKQKRSNHYLLILILLTSRRILGARITATHITAETLICADTSDVALIRIIQLKLWRRKPRNNNVPAWFWSLAIWRFHGSPKLRQKEIWRALTTSFLSQRGSQNSLCIVRLGICGATYIDAFGQWIKITVVRSSKISLALRSALTESSRRVFTVRTPGAPPEQCVNTPVRVILVWRASIANEKGWNVFLPTEYQARRPKVPFRSRRVARTVGEHFYTRFILESIWRFDGQWESLQRVFTLGTSGAPPESSFPLKARRPNSGRRLPYVLYSEIYLTPNNSINVITSATIFQIIRIGGRSVMQTTWIFS